MNYINWVNAEPAMHTQSKSCLFMVYTHFKNILLGSVCYSFVRDFFIYVHERYWSVVFFYYKVFVWCWY